MREPVESTVGDLASSCRSCGRVFVPARAYCSACFMTPTVRAEVPQRVRILAKSEVVRFGSDAVLPSGTVLAQVQDVDSGSWFTAPLAVGFDPGTGTPATTRVQTRHSTGAEGDSDRTTQVVFVVPAEGE